MATAPQPPTSPWWKPGWTLPGWAQPVWALVVEVWVGSFLFAIIFAPAVGLDLAVKGLKTSFDVSEFLVNLLTWTKYTIAVLDALLYVVFMVNMAWRFLNDLQWRSGHARNQADH